MITKYDLYAQVYMYFISTLTQPRHPFTPDTVHDFVTVAAMKALNFEKPNEFKRYVMDAADYYGVDINKAVTYVNTKPWLGAMFVAYAKQNIVIEDKDFGDVFIALFSWVGRTVGTGLANLAAGIIKPLLPIAILLWTGYIVFKQSKKRYT